MRAARTDDNQREIVKVLRVAGATVRLMHRVGQGFPDLIFSWRGRIYLAEVKNAALGWKLTEPQKLFRAEWPEPILIFDSVDTVIGWLKTNGN